MKPRFGSERAAARKDWVHSTLIQGAMAIKVKSVGGRLACRVTLCGMYCLETLKHESVDSRSGT